MEWLSDNVLLDGAHNPAGAQVLAAYLEQQGLHNLHLVFGLKADKQAAEILSPLLPHVAQLYVTRPPVDEGIDPQQLVALAQGAGVAARGYETPSQALLAAQETCLQEGNILVAGSLFLVAAIRELLLPETAVLPITAEQNESI